MGKSPNLLRKSVRHMQKKYLILGYFCNFEKWYEGERSVGLTERLGFDTS